MTPIGVEEHFLTAGIAVATNPEWDAPEAGGFARNHDPEENPVKSWEPPSE
jgi:glyoxylase I family protein